MKGQSTEIGNTAALLGAGFLQWVREDISRGIWRSPEQRKESRLNTSRAGETERVMELVRDRAQADSKRVENRKYLDSESSGWTDHVDYTEDE